MVKSIFHITCPRARGLMVETKLFICNIRRRNIPFCLRFATVYRSQLLCNSLDVVSLCVDVLRGNHTTTERAVITESRFNQNWKLSLEPNSLSHTRTGCYQLKAVVFPFIRTHCGLRTSPLSLTFVLHLKHVFIPSEKQRHLVSGLTETHLLPVSVHQNKTVIHE